MHFPLPPPPQYLVHLPVSGACLALQEPFSRGTIKAQNIKKKKTQRDDGFVAKSSQHIGLHSARAGCVEHTYDCTNRLDHAVRVPFKVPKLYTHRMIRSSHDQVPRQTHNSTTADILTLLKFLSYACIARFAVHMAKYADRHTTAQQQRYGLFSTLSHACIARFALHTAKYADRHNNSTTSEAGTHPITLTTSNLSSKFFSCIHARLRLRPNFLPLAVLLSASFRSRGDGRKISVPLPVPLLRFPFLFLASRRPS